jgi:hypothetical protein
MKEKMNRTEEEIWKIWPKISSKLNISKLKIHFFVKIKFWLSFVSNTEEFELRLKALNFWRQMKDFFGARYRI